MFISKKIVVLLSLLVFTSLPASPGAMFGIGYSFGGGSGGLALTFKISTSNKENKAIATAGVSYYPLSKTKKYGIDLGGGYLFKNTAVVGSWDFIQESPQLSIGYVNTSEDSDYKFISTPTPTPVPVPGPGPGA